jgi:phage terminase large subunit-like protein
MVREVIEVAASAGMRTRPYKEVRAAEGRLSVSPIAALYETGKVHHVGSLPHLEDQLCAFTTVGYMGEGSPDRADALVWTLNEFFPSYRALTTPTGAVPSVALGRGKPT